MVDLGKYAVEVTAAYAVSLSAMVALVLVYVLRNRRVAAKLCAAEARKDA